MFLYPEHSSNFFFVFIIVMDVSDILIVGDVNILFQKYCHPQKDPKVSWKRKMWQDCVYVFQNGGMDKCFCWVIL